MNMEDSISLLNCLDQEILMGDRTETNLTILKSHRNKVIEILESGFYTEYVEVIEELLIQPDDPLLTFTFDEVNYGELEFLDILRDAGIAYSSEWNSGDSYPAGEAHVRFNAEGKIQEMSFALEDACLYTDTVKEIIGNKTTSDTEKVELMKDLIARYDLSYVPWSWDNQEEYGKIYQTIKLIKPGGTK